MACFEEHFDLEGAFEQMLEEEQEREGRSRSPRRHAEEEAEEQHAPQDAEAQAEPGEPAGEPGDADEQGSTAAGSSTDAPPGPDAFGITLDEGNVPEAEELPTSGRAFATRAERLGLTYPRCPVPLEVVVDKLLAIGCVKGVRACVETHEDGSPHIHAFVQKTRNQLGCRDFDISYQDQNYHPNIRKIANNTHAVHWYFYLQKETVPLQKGVFKTPSLGGRSKKGIEVLKEAERDGTEAALRAYVEQGGALEKVPNMARAIEIVKKKELKVPRWQKNADEHTIVLRAWQRDLLAKLDQPPKKRQLFWVSGPPDSGKSTFANYLATHFGKDDVFYAGKSVCYENLVWMYKCQCVVVFDFPKSYDWMKMGPFAASCIEKFTEFGNIMTTPRYTGKHVQLLGHCIVFSNIECIPELMHRDIVEVNLLKMSEAERNRV